MGIVIAMVLVPGLFELKSVAVLKLELEMQRQAGRLAMTTKGGLSRMTEVGKVPQVEMLVIVPKEQVYPIH